MRWVVREGCVRGEGRYLDCDEGWADWPGRAYKYNGRGWAEGDADQFGGRVVKLVAKRKPVVGYGRDADAMPWPGGGTICVAAAKEMGGLRMSLEKAEAEVERLRGERDAARLERDRANVKQYAFWKALAKRLRRERDAFRGNLDAMLEDYDKLRGPAPSDEEIGRAVFRSFYPSPPVAGWGEVDHAKYIAAGKAARALPMVAVELTYEECDRLEAAHYDGTQDAADTYSERKRAGMRALLAAAGRYVEAKTDLGHVYDPTDAERDALIAQGRRRERAAIVAYLRGTRTNTHPATADAIERGEHEVKP